MRPSLSSLKDKILAKRRQKQNEANLKKRNDIVNQMNELMKEIESENISQIKEKYERKIRLILNSIKNEKLAYNRTARNSQYFGNLNTERSKSSLRLAPREQFSLKDLSFESTNKKASSKLLSSPYDKEMSIRELQFQEKMNEIKNIEGLDDSNLIKTTKRRCTLFQEVLVRPENRQIHRSLSKYNKQENCSVERVARTNSPFKAKNPCKPPLPSKSCKKIKPRPTIDLGPNCVYLTEKEENFRWNDITSKQLEDKVRKSIQEVDQVLNLNDFTHITRSLSITPRIRQEQLNPNKDTECKTPSPRSSFKKFRQLLKANNLVVDEESQTPTLRVNGNIIEALDRSKGSLRSNSEADTRDDYLKPKHSLSPNLRYKQNENNTAVSSQDQKIIITDDLKMSNDDNCGINKDTSSQASNEGSERASNKEDSLCEYKETDWSPQFTIPSPEKAKNVLFSVRVEKEDRCRNFEEVKVGTLFKTDLPIVEEEAPYVHPKLQFITSQLPLYSITEDVNSPYFASSPSNITAYVRRQSTPLQGISPNTAELKNTSNIESIDADISADRKLGGATFQTTTSISDNYLEHANIDRLEKKLDTILSRRNQRMQIFFEHYLNEKDKEITQPLSATPKTEKRLKPRSKMYAASASGVKKTSKPISGLYLGSSCCKNSISQLKPVLRNSQSSKASSSRRYNN